MEHDNKNSAVEQAELEIIAFYIDIGEKRVQEIQADIDNGKVTGDAIFVQQSVIRAWKQRLPKLERQRKEILWQIA